MRSFWVLLLERSQIAGPCHGEFALACFHDFIVHYGPAGISDHAPMVVQYGSNMKSGMKPFRSGHEATGSICGRETEVRGY